MRVPSLRTRMMTLSAVATLIALAVAAWAVAGSFERFVIQGLDQRLDSQIAVLSSAVAPDGSIDRQRIAGRLAVVSDGPGWRWRIAGPRGALQSTDFPDLRRAPLPPLPPPPIGVDDRGPRPLDGVDRHGRVHARQAVIATASGPVTITAAAPTEVIARPVRGALIPLLAIVGVLALTFAAAAWANVHFALKPLGALGRQIAAMRTGVRAQVDEDLPSELRPLAAELNALGRDNAATLAASRQSAANLAHALKTPVATLALTVGDDTAAMKQVRRIEHVIGHHLSRARAAAINQRSRSELAKVVEDVVAAVGTLNPNAAFDIDIARGLLVTVDPDDLAEIVGNLVDNAARHATTRVAIAAAEDGQAIRLTIDDDGPGITADQRERAMRPGIRLDEHPAGDGFGLAIVRQLLAACGGTLQLDQAPIGGLRTTVIFRSALPPLSRNEAR